MFDFNKALKDWGLVEKIQILGIVKNFVISYPFYNSDLMIKRFSRRKGKNQKPSTFYILYMILWESNMYPYP